MLAEMRFLFSFRGTSNVLGSLCGDCPDAIYREIANEIGTGHNDLSLMAIRCGNVALTPFHDGTQNLPGNGKGPVEQKAKLT